MHGGAEKEKWPRGLPYIHQLPIMMHQGRVEHHPVPDYSITASLNRASSFAVSVQVRICNSNAGAQQRNQSNEAWIEPWLTWVTSHHRATRHTRGAIVLSIIFLATWRAAATAPFPHPVDMLIVADCSTTLCHIQLPTSRPTLFVWTGGSHSITTIECGCHSQSVYLFKLEYSGDCLKKPPSHTPPIHTKDGNVSGDKNYWQTMASHIPKSIYPPQVWRMEYGSRVLYGEEWSGGPEIDSILFLWSQCPGRLMMVAENNKQRWWCDNGEATKRTRRCWSTVEHDLEESGNEARLGLKVITWIDYGIVKTLLNRPAYHPVEWNVSNPPTFGN